MQRRRNCERCRRNRADHRIFHDCFRQFFEEQRHAIRALDDFGHDLARQCRGVADDSADQCVAFVPPEATQRQCRHMGLSRPRRLIFRAEGRDQQYRQTIDLLNDQVEQLAGGRVGPMQILEDHQNRLATRQTAELSQ
jgi:hypothetical protein